MPGKHRQNLAAAIHGRRQGLVAAALEQAVQQAEEADIAQAAERAQFATELMWPTANGED